MKLELLGVCKFTGAGAIVANSGMLASITHNGAGDNTLTLNASYAVDATECVSVLTTRRAVAASGNTTWGLVHVSDTAKRVTSLVEAGGGAASILANTDGELTLWRIKS